MKHTVQTWNQEEWEEIMHDFKDSKLLLLI